MVSCAKQPKDNVAPIQLTDGQQIQGREKEGRRDDKILYLALTNPGLLRPWLDPIRRRKVPLAGIYSLSLLSASLLPYVVTKPGNNALLVSLQGASNLRQSFFIGRDLKVSRRAHLPMMEGHQSVEAIVNEVEKLRRYLMSLRLLPRRRWA